MFFYLFKIAWRQLIHNRVFSALNIFGFALGLAACIILVLSLVDDFQYDRHYDVDGRIYRIYMRWINEDGELGGSNAPSSGALTSRVVGYLPEVKSAVRMQYWGPRDVHRGDKPGENVNLEIVHADSNFLDVFGFKVTRGSEKEALRTFRSVIITEKVAGLLFGDEDPVGKAIAVPGIDDAYVAAVIETPSARSHMQIDVVIPFDFNDETQHWLNNWGNFWTLGYLRVDKDADPVEIGKKMNDLFVEHSGLEWAQYARFNLMPIEDIHLHSSSQAYNWLNYRGQSMETILLLAGIAIAILLLAAINFINLSSATAAKRAKEVGLRKTVGANPYTLRLQYITESILTTFFAVLISLAMVEASLPHLANILGKDLSGMMFQQPLIIAALLGAALLIGLLSGIYPAAVLTAFKPVEVLKGDFSTSKAGRRLRQVLVVFQFTISITLFVAMFIMVKQLHYVQNQNWGYDRERVLFFQAGEGDEGIQKRETFLRELENSPKILAAGSSNMAPGENPPFNRVLLAGPANPDSATGLVHFDIRAGWFEALKIPVLQGRSFYKDNDADLEHSVILNESAVKELKLEDPVGKPFYWGGGDEIHSLTIVGVVADFHFGSARDEQEAAMFHPYNRFARQVVVRLPQGGIQEGIKEVERIYKEFFGGTPSWAFLDDHFNLMYQDDKRIANSVALFSGLAVIIACLGILGLSSYTTEQKRREIAIRKVLGARETSLVYLLGNQFLRWVLIANLIAWPLAGWGMYLWLGQFVYKASITFVPFLLAGGLALLIAAITVSTLTIRISRMNPTEAIRQG